jgi:CHAT domain-containing protein
MVGQQPITNRFGQQFLRLLVTLALVMAGTSLAISQSVPMNEGSFWTPPGSPVNMTPTPSMPGMNTGQTPTPWQQTSNPMMAPSGNGRPTIDQTRWYINNSPYFQNMDPGIKDAIIYSGAASGLLSGSYLPNGSPNPFYQNGQVISNWYVPSTWSSTQTNWQGVQQNGFLPNATGSGAYVPSWTNPTSTFSPSSATSAYRPTYTYTPPAIIQNPTNLAPRPMSNSPFQYLSNTSLQRFSAYTPKVMDLGKFANDVARASALHESAGDKIAQAISYAQLAHLFLQKDNPELALMQVEAAEPLAANTRNLGLKIDLLWLKAAAQMSSGEFEEAITTYRETMRQLRLQGNQTGQAEAFASLAWAFQSLGRVAEAQEAYKDAFIVFQMSNNRDGQAKSLIGMGSLYASIGDYQKAFDKFLEGAKIATEDQYARILVSYAGLLQSQGEHAWAMKVYDKASQMHHDDKVLNGTIWAGMGRSEVALGNYGQAGLYLERARLEMSDAGDLRGEAGILASIAELEFWTNLNPASKHNFSAAAASYDRALTLMRQTGDRAGEVGVLAGVGQVFEVQGKLQKAIDSYNQALTRLEDLRTSARLEEFRINEANQSENLYGHVAELQVRAHNMEEAFNLSERARARAFLDLLGNSRADSRQVPADIVSREESLRKENILLERQLGQEFSKPLPEVDQQRMRALQTRLSDLRVRYQQSLDALKAANPSYASFLSVSPLTLKQAQQQLGPEVTSLSYFTLPDMTLAFVVTRDGFHAFKLRVTEKELGLAVSALLDFASNAETTEASKHLYKMLIAPLKSELKSRTLLISPYGVLHNLPFAALSPDGEEYFADTYSITLLPSISAWPYLYARAKNDASSALVMAGDDVEGFPYLSGGHKEADMIAALFGAKPLFAEAATVSTLREHGGEYSILHLMAHLDHDTQNPRSSRIVLAQDLNIEDVLDLNLRKTSLVVLSGCQSGKGAQTRGDDMIALSRAFMYAGAPSVMASLWSVDDQATEQLMVAFYSHLHDGLSKADALQAAQKDVRRSYPNPYYWASFELLGDPGTPVESSVSVASKPHL